MKANPAGRSRQYEEELARFRVLGERLDAALQR
jgi:hypothetical protein